MHAAHHQLAEARDLDRRILETHALLSRAERDLALLLAELADKRHFFDLGYANVRQYAEVKLSLEPRKTRGLVRIGRALPDLPVLDQAFASGALCWTKARELLAVVTPQVEAEWVEQACQSSSRELERLVAAHRPGEPPSRDEVKDAGPVRLSFSMEPVEAEQLRTLLSALRSAAGVSREEVGDGALLAQAATRLLDDLDSTETPTGERFRMVIEHCPRCGRTETPEAVVSETHVGQACCDAEILEMREGPTRGHITRTIPPATRRAVLQRDRHRCQVPGCSNRLWLDIHHLEYFSDGGDHSEQNLITLCCTHHQLVHDGMLGIERDAEGLVFRFGDGRVVNVTHVGKAGRGRSGVRAQADLAMSVDDAAARSAGWSTTVRNGGTIQRG
jgi:5-methylcytosine-specific restriction endonuclease McrA